MSKLTISWLVFVTIACVAIWAVAAIWVEDFVIFSLFLAGGSFALSGLFALLVGITRIFRDLDDDSKYIKTMHPEVWRKLHPWGDSSYNSLNGIAFVSGQYDDGTDTKLNEIKRKYVADTIPLLWFLGLTMFSFFMTFVVSTE